MLLTHKKISNVASEIHKDDDFSYFSYFCLLLLKRCCSPTKTPPSRTGKHHGPEGRTNPRIAPKKCLTSLLKPIENDVMILATFVFCCWRGAAHPQKSLTSLLKPIENDNFSYFGLLLLKRCCSPTKTPPSRTEKHHGPEGRTRPRIAPKNSLTSLLKPIENSHFSYFCLLLLKRCCSPTKKSLTSPLKSIKMMILAILATFVFCCWRGAAHPQRHHPPGRGNIMALKDELIQESHQKSV